MEYHQFNNKVLDYYISRSTTSSCNLSIDGTDLEQILPANQIKQFSELKYSWDHLLQNINNIPQYFGLIAIQCFAANQMQKDDNYSEAAYRVRLRHLLGLQDDGALQTLFKGDDPNKRIQEEIWYSAKFFFKSRFGQELEIPTKTTFAGRYVQYPKSQALLNLEDLKYFTIFFSQEFSVRENVPFSYFKERLVASLENFDTSPRTALVLEDLKKKESCLLQIYDYFNLWDGKIYDIKVGTRSPPSTTKAIKCAIRNSKLLLVFEQDQPRFFAINENEEILSKVNELQILDRNDTFYPHFGMLTFNELEYYPEEFVSSRFLFVGADNYVALDISLRPSEYLFLEQYSLLKFSLSEKIKLYKYRIEENTRPSIFSKIIQTQNPVRLVGGLKVSRKKEYLEGFAPIIECRLPHIVIYQNSRCEYSSSGAKAGIYKIRLANFKDAEFEIVSAKELSVLIESKNLGWNLEFFRMDAKFDVEGCNVICEKDNEIRTWIDLNLSKNKKHYRGKNLLLKAINRATI